MNVRILCIAALTLPCACTVYEPLPERPPAEQERPQSPVSIPRESPPPLDSRAGTINAMLQQAQAQRMAGQLAAAESTLETALRIDSRDARLWLELAQIRLAANDYVAARTTADRALSLAAGNLQIIEAARRIQMQASR